MIVPGVKVDIFYLFSLKNLWNGGRFPFIEADVNVELGSGV